MSAERTIWAVAVAVASCNGSDSKPTSGGAHAPSDAAEPISAEISRCEALGLARIGSSDPAILGHGAGPDAYDRHHPLPHVTFAGPPAVQGDLDGGIVRRFLRREMRGIAICYGSFLNRDRKARGEVALDFSISVTGQATRPTVSGLGDAELTLCIERRIVAAKFPASANGGSTEVHTSFALAPGAFRPGRDLLPPFPQESSAPPRTADPALGPAPDVGPLEVALRAALPGLRRCYESRLARKEPLPTTYTIEVSVEDTGAVRLHSATGIDDEDSRTCLSDTLGTLRVPAPPNRFHAECPLTLGGK